MSKPKVCENCESTDIRWVRYIMKNNRTQLRTQCFSCGRLDLVNYKYSEVDDINKIPHMDNDLRDRFYDKKKQIRDVKKSMYENGKSYYKEVYLSSQEWKNKRRKVIDRDKGMCRICCKTDNLQVHHIKYSNLYKEPLSNLLTLCNKCHSIVHSDINVSANCLTYNFGVLRVCDKCGKLHNDNRFDICFSCAGFSYTNEDAKQVFEYLIYNFNLCFSSEVVSNVNKSRILVDFDGNIHLLFPDQESLNFGIEKKEKIYKHFSSFLQRESLKVIVRLDYSKNNK